MKRYKAMVTDKETKKRVEIESWAKTKTAFIMDLRKNGYSVNPLYVKEFRVYNYIMNETNCNKWDWQEINEVPGEYTAAMYGYVLQ